MEGGKKTRFHELLWGGGGKIPPSRWNPNYVSTYVWFHVVFVSPPDVFITIINGTASYTCVVAGISNDFIDTAQWLLNNTIIDNEDLEQGNLVISSSTTSLSFRVVPVRYNGTSIKCRATLTSGRVTTSSSSMLLIQGLLEQVCIVYI